jgi:hypothetical protein
VTTPASPPPSTEPRPRRIGLAIVTIAFGMFTFAHWGQIAGQVLGQTNEPGPLLVMHFASGCAAYAAMFATWRRRHWGWIASVVYGVLTALLVWAVGPAVGLDVDERGGLIPGAISVLMIGTGLGLYLRNALRPPAR